VKTLEILLAAVGTVTQKVSSIPIFGLQGITKVYHRYILNPCLSADTLILVSDDKSTVF
jgi:hypothetical protein